MANNSTDSLPTVDENFALNQQLADQLAQILAYWHQQRQRHQRASLVLIGSKAWQTTLLEVPKAQFADWPSELLWLDSKANRQHLRHQLGQTRSAQQAGLVVNMAEGLDIEAITLAEGLLPGGGICCWLLPEETAGLPAPSEHPLAKLLSFPWHAQDMTPHYALWARERILNADQQLVLLETDSIDHPDADSHINQNITHTRPPSTQPPSAQPPSAELTALSAEQSQLLQLLYQHFRDQVTQQPASPTLLVAARGRGKSTLIGHLINRLLADVDTPYQIALCSARPEQHQQAWLCLKPKHQDTVTRWAPDALLAQQPTLDWLIIDEAAHLPWPQLQKLIRHYPHCLLSSTSAGYEGSGQAWQQHLRPWLDQHFSDWREFTLTQALRWHAEDPLEALVRELSGQVDHQLNEQDSDTAGLTPLPLQHLSWQCVTPQDLLASQRAQVFALLTQSHYQTRPRDWQLLCSAPNYQLALIWHNSQLVGALWGIMEGPLPDWGPERRLQGHLVTQKLRQHHQTPALYSGRYARCTRIAIAKPYRQQGLGKQLVSYWQSHPHNSDIDSFTVSFGASPALWRFWSACGFHTLHLGVQADAASGRSNLIMMTPPQAQSLRQAYAQIQSWFQAQWLALSDEFQPLSHDLISVTEQQAWQVIWQQHPDWQVRPWQQIPPHQRQQALQDYALGSRPYEAVSGALIDWFEQQSEKKWHWPEAELWRWKQQGQSWAQCRQAWSAASGQAHIGRKGLEALLKARLQAILDFY